MPATALIAAAGILTFTNPALQCIVEIEIAIDKVCNIPRHASQNFVAAGNL